MGAIEQQSVIRSFIAQEKLPDSFSNTIIQWYLPLVDELAAQVSAGELSCLGVSGCQGSGKSTLAGFIATLLSKVHGLSVVSLSMDDVYLTREERKTLARDVHPLLATRGVPGTHDVSLAISTIKSLHGKGEVFIPRFDKSQDDRLPKDQWDKVQASVDLVIVEGWCLGVPPQDAGELSHPVNDLERTEDAGGRWRAYVNQCLGGEYVEWFKFIEKLIWLKAPDFDAVYRWRGRQEEKLKQKLAAEAVDTNTTKVMNPAELSRFIQHYERLTCHSLEALPAIADVIFELSDEQQITRCIQK